MSSPRAQADVFADFTQSDPISTNAGQVYLHMARKNKTQVGY